MSSESSAVCAYCGSPIKFGARKCPSCLEYLDGRQDSKSGAAPAVSVELVKGAFDLLGKAAVPAALLAALLLFRADISEKLTGTESVQIGDYGIKFRFPESRGGSVELEALALYWLLDTAKRPVGSAGGLNYNALKPDDLSAIESLKVSGLVMAVTTEVSDEEARKQFGIKKSLALTITEKGKEFLASAKLASIRPAEADQAASGASR